MSLVQLMHECHVPTIAQELVHEGINETSRRNPNRPYHNGLHPAEVVEDVILIGDREGVDSWCLGLLAIGGGWHDVEQGLKGEDANEAASSEAARKAMRDAQPRHRDEEFKVSDYHYVHEFIWGTRYRRVGGAIVQKAKLEEARMLADADLANLGKPPEVFMEHSNNYFREIHPGQPLSGPIYREYLEGVTQMLKHHRFFTQTARLYFPHVEENLLHVIGLLNNKTD